MQNSNKKTLIIIGALSGVLVILSLVYFALASRSGGALPLPGFAPTPTPTYRPLTNEEAAVNQAETDKELGERLEKIYDSYPWLDKLPLQSDKYFIYFDLEDKRFHGTIYAPQFSAEAQALEAQLLQDLQHNGIDTQDFQFIWEYNSPPTQ